MEKDSKVDKNIQTLNMNNDDIDDVEYRNIYYYVLNNADG